MALVDLMPFGSGSSSPRNLHYLSETLNKKFTNFIDFKKGRDHERHGLQNMSETSNSISKRLFILEWSKTTKQTNGG